MKSKRIIRLISLLFSFLLTVTSANSQTANLLQNPNADDGTNYWRAYGNASVEHVTDGRFCFAVRNGGYFIQDVTLPEGSVGRYALLIGRASSERINPDGAITGLPYLHGYMLERANPLGGIIKAYLQSEEMRCGAGKVGEWTTVWGVFQVPPETGAIRFFLNQAERRGVPHNGSAARFDDLGVYLFTTEKEAMTFVDAYKGQ
jgi:hypothetical protein